MRTAAALMAAVLLAASIATTAVWAYPTMADRGGESAKVQVAAELPQETPRPAPQIRVVLPAPWETSSQAKR
jgi:hypothetical protein